MCVSYPASFCFLGELVRKGQVPQVTADHFVFRIQRIMKRFRLHHHDAEELGQDMLLAVVRAKASHRDDGAPLSRYLKSVLNRAYCDVCRKLREECVRRSRTRSIEDDVDPRNEHDVLVLCDAVRYVANGAKQQTAELAFDLGRMTPSEVARARGVHRGTILRQAEQLQPLFRDANEKM